MQVVLPSIFLSCVEKHCIYIDSSEIFLFSSMYIGITLKPAEKRGISKSDKIIMKQKHWSCKRLCWRSDRNNDLSLSSFFLKIIRRIPWLRDIWECEYVINNNESNHSSILYHILLEKNNWSIIHIQIILFFWNIM